MSVTIHKISANIFVAFKASIICHSYSKDEVVKIAYDTVNDLLIEAKYIKDVVVKRKGKIHQ